MISIYQTTTVILIINIIRLFIVMQGEKKGLNAVIFGSTGAVGSTLLKELLQSELWGKVICVARHEPEQWTQLHNKGKLYVQIQPDMGRLEKTQDWKYEGIDAMFVCFGSQVKEGEQQFTKIDKTYPLLCADIALKNKIPHYLFVSSAGADCKSSTLFRKVKGEAELDLMAKKMNLLTIIRPGLIKNRPNQRTKEKIAEVFSFLLPIIPSIECMDVGLALKGLAETQLEQSKQVSPVAKIYQNVDLQKFLQAYTGKK